MKFKKLSAVVILASAISTTFAQKEGGRKIYDMAVGVCAEMQSSGSPYIGPSFKYLFHTKTSIEVQALSDDFKKDFEVSALLDYFGPFPDVPQNFRWMIGGGIHAAKWLDVPFQTGIDGQLGVEYAMRHTPIAISCDWHPIGNIVPTPPKVILYPHDNRFQPIKFGITLRYTIMRKR